MSLSLLLRAKRVVGLAVTALVLLVSSSAFAAQTDGGVYPPPATGPFAYSSFVPPLTPGASYIDPVFGERVRRLTTDHAHDDIYARNMWWSADGTRYLHRTVPDTWKVIDVATGAVTHSGIENGFFPGDGGFDPVDPDVLYYLSGSAIHQITLNPNGTWTDSVYWTAPGGAAIKGLGGTLNWFDASGRYMLVRYGAEPSVHLLDRQNLSAGPYANAINATNSVDANSYLGVSPDGQFIVGYDGRAVGLYGIGQGLSYKLNHATRTITASPTIFWSLCGDHGSFLSASDGRTYMVVSNCGNSPELWRVDVTNNTAGLSESQQRALPNNKLLIAWPGFSDCCGHVSTSARSDWAFVATEDGSDNGSVSPWHAYRQEIIAVHVLTGEVRRLAHHRSRGFGDYYAQPRISAAWDGSAVAFASNFNQSGVVDIYAIPFAPSSTNPVPSVSSLAPSNVLAGAAGFSLTVSGTNFVSTSVVRWNGTNRATTFVSSTQLRATILVTDVVTAGTAQVTVVNPAPGGGTSNPLTFTIASGFSVAVVRAGSGAGTVTSAPSGINCGASCSARFASGTSVVLTAAPDSQSTLAGWSGCDTVLGPQCTVVLTTSKTVTATFDPIPDTTTPAVTITAPTSGATYTTGNPAMTLGGTASDNVGVTQVTWTNSRGGNGTATGTTSWTASGIGLQMGTNMLTVQARDAAGNTKVATLTATLTDTAPPAITITAPTSGATYTTSTSSLTLAGTASDNVGVTQVTWMNSLGGNGTATGTTSWTAGVALQTGANVLTVQARDAAGNTATATLTVTLTDTFAFADDPLAAQSTMVKAVHILELRAAIDSVRVARGLTAFAWTDPTLTPGSTTARAVHVTELRSALNQAYQAAGQALPTYTDAPAGAAAIKATHLNEVRTAVRAL